MPVVSQATSSDKTVAYNDPPSLAGSGFSGTPYNPLLPHQGPVGGRLLVGSPGANDHPQYENPLKTGYPEQRGNTNHLKTGYPDQHGDKHYLKPNFDSKMIGQQLLSGMTGAGVVQSPHLPFSHNESTNYSFRPSLIPNDDSHMPKFSSFANLPEKTGTPEQGNTHPFANGNARSSIDPIYHYPDNQPNTRPVIPNFVNPFENTGNRSKSPSIQGESRYIYFDGARTIPGTPASGIHHGNASTGNPVNQRDHERPGYPAQNPVNSAHVSNAGTPANNTHRNVNHNNVGNTGPPVQETQSRKAETQNQNPNENMSNQGNTNTRHEPQPEAS
jgi:hypothetical protein